jgi:hypothetical protein
MLRKKGDSEKAENPFNNPVPTREIISTGDNDGQRARGASERQSVLTGQLEREFLQLCLLARSEQLSIEDHLKLEEIRRATGLTILFNSRHGHPSTIRGASLDTLLVPPSNHTRGSQASYIS